MTKLDLQPVLDLQSVETASVADKGFVIEPPESTEYSQMWTSPEESQEDTDHIYTIAQDMEIPLNFAEEISDTLLNNDQQYKKRTPIYKRALFGLINKAVVQPLKNLTKKGKAVDINVTLDVLSKVNKIKEEENREIDKDELFGLFEKARVKEEKEIQQSFPRIEISKAETIPEKAVEIGTGITAFVAKLIVAKKAIGGTGATSEIAAFEAVNLADDGTPGMGLLIGSSLGLIGSIPAASTLGKAAKLGGQGGVLAGVTAMEGGSPEEIAVAFFLPGILHTLRQFPNIIQGKAFEAKIAKEVQAKGFSAKDAKSVAKSVRDAVNVKNGNMTPNQWGAKHGKNLNDIRAKYINSTNQISKATKALTEPSAVTGKAKIPPKVPVTKPSEAPAAQTQAAETKTPQEAEKAVESEASLPIPQQHKGAIEFWEKLHRRRQPNQRALSQEEEIVVQRIRDNSTEYQKALEEFNKTEVDTLERKKATRNVSRIEREIDIKVSQMPIEEIRKEVPLPSQEALAKQPAVEPVAEEKKGKARPGFVDLTPLANAGQQVKTTTEKAVKGVTRFTGLEPKVKKVLIEMEEQLRDLPKKIAKQSIEKYGKLSEAQEELIKAHVEKPSKNPIPEELQKYVDKVLEENQYSKEIMEEIGYSADWPNKYREWLQKKLKKAESAEQIDELYVDSLKQAIEEAEGLEYLHRQYKKLSAGRRIKGWVGKAITKKPRGVLGRKIPTREKAKELGFEEVPLAVSQAHMIHEVEKAKAMNDLILAINENPNLSLPENQAPEDWVRIDERIFPASVSHSTWVEEGKPRYKRTYRKYPVPIAEALEELTYSRGNEALERAYDKLNFGLKIIGFYNPLVMAKNDAIQVWRAVGVKGFAPLILPQVSTGGGQLSIDTPKAIKIWSEKGAEYEKLRKGGLFNNVVNYTPAVTEITQGMLNHIRETSGERAARIIGERIGNPLKLLGDLRELNNKTTWNMDEIMRIACYEAVKDAPILDGMTDSEKIEWVNDAMVNYGKMPKSTKRWLNKVMFTPQYKAGNFRFFFGEAEKVYKGQWRHLAPIIRTVAYKVFVKWGLPAIAAAAIYHALDEERDVRTEKGYRLVIHNPDTNTDTVYALSDPLLEGAKLTQRTLRHTMMLNLAPLPSLVVRMAGGPRFKQSRDKFGEFFKLGTPLYRDILNWTDKDKTVPQKILTQMAIAFVYKRRGREKDEETAVESLAKALSIWTDWKEQKADLKQMISGRSYYLGPGGKFGRLYREFRMEQDEDRSEIDNQLDKLIGKGDYKGAIKLALETERYADMEGISGRIETWRAPLYSYFKNMTEDDITEFRQWLVDNKKYTKKELAELVEAIDKSKKAVYPKNNRN